MSDGMSDPATESAREPTGPRSPADRARFRRNLVGVLAVQLVTLIALWLLQARYTG